MREKGGQKERKRERKKKRWRERQGRQEKKGRRTAEGNGGERWKRKIGWVGRKEREKKRSEVKEE